MKIVINKCYGGFGISETGLKILGEENYWDIGRTDERLISLIENGYKIDDYFAKLVVVEIPDEATDWKIDEYDGFERVIYVVDGKIFQI